MGDYFNGGHLTAQLAMPYLFNLFIHICVIFCGLAILCACCSIDVYNCFIIINGRCGHSTLTIRLVGCSRGLHSKITIRITNQLVHRGCKQFYNCNTNCNGSLLLTTQRLLQGVIRSLFGPSALRHILQRGITLYLQRATVHGQRFRVFLHNGTQCGVRTLGGGTCLFISCLTRLIIQRL